MLDPAGCSFVLIEIEEGESSTSRPFPPSQRRIATAESVAKPKERTDLHTGYATAVPSVRGRKHMCARCSVCTRSACVGVDPWYPEGAARKVQGLDARCRWRELKPKHVRAGPSWPMILPFYSIFRRFTVSAPLSFL